MLLRPSAAGDSTLEGASRTAETTRANGIRMPRLEDASHRLQVAIDRLEQVVTARAAQAGPKGKGGGGDAALREALDAARRENAQLQQIAGTVSRRLDATIGRLRKLVG